MFAVFLWCMFVPSMIIMAIIAYGAITDVWNWAERDEDTEDE